MTTPAVATGHPAKLPRQIPYIIGNEGCERFSFYGMRNNLVPFLVSSILQAYLPESMREGAAKDIFHIFVIGVYYFPLLGGWISDRSEEHTSELQALMRITYDVCCLKKKKVT